MTIEPYKFANGDDAWGAPTEQTPGPEQVGKPTRGRASHSLVLRLRRARTDPNWASHSPETKQRLLDLDRKEGF